MYIKNRATGHLGTLCRTWMFFVLLLSMNMMSSCIDEDIISDGGPNDGRLRVSLLVEDMEKVVLDSRATASATEVAANERKILNMDIYCYGSDRKLKKLVKQIDNNNISTVLSGSDGRFTLYLDPSGIDMKQNDLLVFVCNHAGFNSSRPRLNEPLDSLSNYYRNCSFMTTERDKSVDINRSEKNAGLNMPIYGEGIYGDPGRGMEVRLRRTVAKIQVKLADDIQDVTGLFGNDKQMSFRITNQQMRTGRTISPEGVYERGDKYYGGDIVFGGDGCTKEQFYGLVGNTATTVHSQPANNWMLTRKAVYIPQFRTSVYAQVDRPNFRSKLIEDDQWDRGRTCVILSVGDRPTDNIISSMEHYRIDLVKDGKFIDLLPNHSYTIVIKRVKAHGYKSLKDAHNNPGGNLEYTIEDSGESCLSTSNGNYALNLSNDGMIILGANNTYKIADVSCTKSEDVDTQELEISRIELFPKNLSGVMLVKENGALVDQNENKQRNFEITDTPQAICLKFTELKPVSGYVVVTLGNLRDTISFRRDVTRSGGAQTYTIPGSRIDGVQWDDNNARVTYAGNTLTMPDLPSRAQSTGIMRGNYSETVQGKSHSAWLTRLHIDHASKNLEEVVRFTDGYGQNAVLHVSNKDLGKWDGTKFTNGNKWVDSPYLQILKNDPSTMNMNINVFGFTVTAPEGITLEVDQRVTKEQLGTVSGFPSYNNKDLHDLIGQKITYGSNAEVTLKMKVGVKNFGTKEVFKITDKNTGAEYFMKVARQGKYSYVGANVLEITGGKKFVSSTVEHQSRLTNTQNWGPQSTGWIKVGINPLVNTKANVNTSEIDLGYRSERVVIQDANGVKEMHYLTQTGLGFNDSGMIELAKIRNSGSSEDNGDETGGTWVYYIRTDNDGAIGVIKITNILRFMVGRANGLEIPEGSGLGSKWDDWGLKHSWEYPDDWDKPYPKYQKDRRYENFPILSEYGKAQDVCLKVYPYGYWRSPNTEELKSWAVPVNGKTSIFPIVESYEKGIKLKIGESSVYVKPPYMIDQYGKYALDSREKLKAIQLGDWYYVYRVAGTGNTHNTYPLGYVNDNTYDQAPLKSSEFPNRDASAVFCIRD